MTMPEFERRATYQDGYDREFDNWKIIDIHQIPHEFIASYEVDFYCSNGKELFLLRFRNRKTEFYEKIEAKNTATITHLLAEFPIQKIDTKIIKLTLEKLKINQK